MTPSPVEPEMSDQRPMDERVVSLEVSTRQLYESVDHLSHALERQAAQTERQIGEMAAAMTQGFDKVNEKLAERSRPDYPLWISVLTALGAVFFWLWNESAGTEQALEEHMKQPGHPSTVSQLVSTERDIEALKEDSRAQNRAILELANALSEERIRSTASDALTDEKTRTNARDIVRLEEHGNHTAQLEAKLQAQESKIAYLQDQLDEQRYNEPRPDQIQPQGK